MSERIEEIKRTAEKMNQYGLVDSDVYQDDVEYLLKCIEGLEAAKEVEIEHHTQTCLDYQSEVEGLRKELEEAQQTIKELQAGNKAACESRELAYRSARKETIVSNQHFAKAYELADQLAEAQSQIAVKNEELKTAYNALEKLQEEFKQLDTGAAEDYQKLVEAQQTIAKLHEIVEEGRNALNSIIEGEWEETMDDQFLEVWTTRRINPPAIADEALFCMARELEALGE